MQAILFIEQLHANVVLFIDWIHVQIIHNYNVSFDLTRAKNNMRTSVNYRTKLDLDRTINDMHGHCVRPKGVASKRTRNKVFSLAGKTQYATGSNN